MIYTPKIRARNRRLTANVHGNAMRVIREREIEVAIMWHERRKAMATKYLAGAPCVSHYFAAAVARHEAQT